MGRPRRESKKLGVTDSLPRGTGSASKSARSKNAKISASRVLTLTIDSIKSLDSEPNNKDKLLLEGSEGKSHNGI